MNEWKKVSHTLALKYDTPDWLDRAWNWVRRRKVTYGEKTMTISYYIRSDKPVKTEAVIEGQTIDVSHVSCIEEPKDAS